MQLRKHCCCVLRWRWPGEGAEIQELNGAVGLNRSRRRQLIPVATLMLDLKGKAEAKEQKKPCVTSLCLELGKEEAQGQQERGKNSSENAPGQEPLGEDTRDITAHGRSLLNAVLVHSLWLSFGCRQVIHWVLQRGLHQQI